MTMVACRACGAQVSRNAQACPRCGEPPAIAKFSNSLPGTLIGMALVVLLFLVLAWMLGYL